MAETSGFFEAELNEETGQWDREYFAHQFASYFKLFFGNGVFGSPTNQLKVLAGDGLKVIVKAGWAFIEGYWYFNEADLELTIEPNTTAFDRQDSIMCRLDMASKKITSVALAGVTDVVRDGNYYDLKLASVIVGVAGTSISNANIVDTRTDQTVCGLVTGVMKVQPTADLFAQFTAQFNLWFETIKGQLSGDVAGNLQNQIGSLPDLKTSVKSSLVEAINELTQKEVDVLDTYEEIMANTTPRKAAGGIGVKQGFIQLNNSLNIRYNSKTDCIEIYYNGTWNEYQKANLQVTTYDFYTLSRVVRLEDTTYCSVTITNGNIAISGKNQTTFGCSVTCLSNPIAFTKGQTVSFNCKSISLGTGSWVRVGLYSSVPSGATNQNIPNIASKNITSAGTATFTVPSDGNYYIGIHACGGNSSGNSVSCNLSSVVTVSK